MLLLAFLPEAGSVAQTNGPDTADTRINVFTPTTAGNTYWPQVYAILRAAAADLGIEILSHEFDVRDRYAKAVEGVDILRSTPDVDGAIFSVAFGQTEPLLRTAEELGIPVMIQGPLFESELSELGGGPRRRFHNWIGVFAEDEGAKGFRLGQLLIEEARRRGSGSDESVRVVGIGGDDTWFGSRLRADGLVRAVSEDRRAELLQACRRSGRRLRAQPKPRFC